MNPAAASPTRFGDYFLIKKIATGGMAEIHLARTRTAQGPEKYVALKMIHPRYMEDGNFHQMIVEEAKIAVQLNHKNIGQVFDLGQVDGRYFLVMEYIDGYDLSRMHDACRNKGLRIPIDVTAFVGREVCAALDYAHNHRDRSGQHLDLIHRDISPQNILVSFGGEVKIVDFGIAKVSTQLQQTQVGVIKGKFYYMSPEQAGAHDVDQRSDLFSLGICLWETLCGRSLFRREGGPTNPLAILHEVRTMPIPRVREFRPDCPRELDELIARALSRDLTRRFQNAAETQASFNRFLINHAPSFSRERLRGFMVEAYEKQETTKETDRITTKMAELMMRTDFKPSEHSVIFALSQPGQAATHIFDSAPPPIPAPARRPAAESAPIVGIADSRSASIKKKGGLARPRAGSPDDVSTDRELRKIAETDLATSDTVFLRKDDVAEMERAGHQPKVMAEGGSVEIITSDPHSQTHSLSDREIQAAHAKFSKQLGKERSPRTPLVSPSVGPSEPTRSDLPPAPADIPLTQHPLFRLLVIGVLVLCVLTATLALLLVQRSRNVSHEMNESLKTHQAPASEADRSP